jgi:DNA-directed RNA polymerase subunit beta'
LGCYYLTAENPQATKGAGRYFASLDDAIRAFEQKQVELHAYVWVRFDGTVQAGKSDDEQVISSETSSDGMVTKVYKNRRVRETADGELISQYVRTTPGRIIYNKAIQDALMIA